MRLSDSTYNPLPALFEIIGEAGIPITRSTITSIAKLFNAGGVVAETEKELLVLINFFIESYGLLEIVIIDNIHYLRKVNGEDSQ